VKTYKGDYNTEKHNKLHINNKAILIQMSGGQAEHGINFIDKVQRLLILTIHNVLRHN